MQFLRPRGSFGSYPGFPHTPQLSWCGREDTCGRDFLLLFKYASIYSDENEKWRPQTSSRLHIMRSYLTLVGMEREIVIPGERERSV